MPCRLFEISCRNLWICHIIAHTNSQTRCRSFLEYHNFERSRYWMLISWTWTILLIYCLIIGTNRYGANRYLSLIRIYCLRVCDRLLFIWNLLWLSEDGGLCKKMSHCYYLIPLYHFLSFLFYEHFPKRGAIAEWLERLGYSAKKIVLGWASTNSVNPQEFVFKSEIRLKSPKSHKFELFETKPKFEVFEVPRPRILAFRAF